MYIGNSNSVQQYSPQIAYFSGDNTTTVFTLPVAVVSAAQIIVYVANVTQNPSSAFTVSGTTLTFTSAPPSGTNNIWVQYNSLQTSVNTLASNPSIVGDTTTSGGFYAVGSFNNSYTDGAILDYVTGNGRLTVGGGDGLTIYNGGPSARNALASWDSTGNLTVPQAIKLSYSSNSNYAVDGTLSNYSSTNGVYLNGNAAGWLRLSNDGTQSTKIDLYGSTYGSPNIIKMFTAGTEALRIDASGNTLLVAAGNLNLSNLNTYSAASAGYQKLPSGIIIQWGYGSTNTSWQTFSFPIAFPNNCFSIAYVQKYGAAGSPIYGGVQNGSLTRTGFNAAQNSGADGFNYIAIGN